METAIAENQASRPGIPAWHQGDAPERPMDSTFQNSDPPLTAAVAAGPSDCEARLMARVAELEAKVDQLSAQ